MAQSGILADSFIERHLTEANYLASVLTSGAAETIAERLPPLKPYIVLHTGRCGSTFLHYESMARQFFPAYEIFNEETLEYNFKNNVSAEGARIDDYIVTTIEHLTKKQRTIEGKRVFGLGITPTQAFLVSRLLDISQLFALLSRDALLILTRRNLLKQAVSFAEASKSGAFHSFSEGEGGSQIAPADGVSEEDIARTLRFLDLLLWQEAYLKRLCEFTPTKPCRYSYEEVIDTPEAIVHRLLGKVMTNKGEWRRDETSRSTVKSSKEGHDRLYTHIFQELYKKGELLLPSGRKLRWNEFLDRFET
jgi:LPS sulfotransferase NodH